MQNKLLSDSPYNMSLEAFLSINPIHGRGEAWRHVQELVLTGKTMAEAHRGAVVFGLENEYKVSRDALKSYPDLQLLSKPMGIFTMKGQQSQHSLTCDGVAIDNLEQLLAVSVCGSESKVKAFRAALQGNSHVQLNVEGMGGGVGARWSRGECSFLRHKAGYRVFKTKLDTDLWHVLAVAKDKSVLLSTDDERLWQEFRSSRFTTPILREWVPYIREYLFKKHGMAHPKSCVGMNVALLFATEKTLDAAVIEGLNSGKITVPGAVAGERFEKPADLDAYLQRYGNLLAAKANKTLDPRHVPGRDPLPTMGLFREPFEPQKHVCAALVKGWKAGNRATMLVAEMGTGKTLMASVAVHQHADWNPYRAIIMCPGQLVNKWERELRQTLPGVIVHQMDSWESFVQLDPTKPPEGAEWYVVSRDRAKLGAGWIPVSIEVHEKRGGGRACPKCGRRLCNKDGDLLSESNLDKSRKDCKFVLNKEGEAVEGCGEQLWQEVPSPRRHAPATFVQRQLKGFFDYFIADEAHEEKSADSAQAGALGKLTASCKYTMLLTGTLIGGYAEHLRPLLFRIAPRTLVEEGLRWSDFTKFNERYGRMETTVYESKTESGGTDNRQSRGKSGRTTKRTRPGVVPTLFGRHLLDKAVFLSLDELAENLPSLEMVQVPVAMDAQLKGEYQRVERILRDKLKEMLVKKDKRLLGAFIQTMLAYPDHPFGWKGVGYSEDGEFIPVVEPKDLGEAIRPKEQALLDFVAAEHEEGRKVWVYVQYNGAHNVQGRVAGLLEKAGYRVGVMEQKVDPKKREAWMAKHGPACDVVVSHPKLVETGLDFFDREMTYNFPTLAFYETGYNLFTLRQAGARSWRIGQNQHCKVAYFAYEDTMQEKALALMGKKLSAAQALEGRFSAEGLAALANDDGDEMALVKAMFERMDKTGMDRVWKKVSAKSTSMHLTGTELVGLMRSKNVKVAELAATLKMPPARVTRARKEGVSGDLVRMVREAVEHLGKDRVKVARGRAGAGVGERVAARSPRAGAKRKGRAS